ncbi:hypothetical protein Tco_0293962 [Tanacetum coccineum]
MQIKASKNYNITSRQKNPKDEIDKRTYVTTTPKGEATWSEMKLVVEIKSFGMSFDEFDKEIRSSDGLQPKQADQNYVHALNELNLHEIRVVTSKHEVDQC